MRPCQCVVDVKVTTSLVSGLAGEYVNEADGGTAAAGGTSTPIATRTINHIRHMTVLACVTKAS